MSAADRAGAVSDPAAACQRIAAALPREWSWDGYFRAALTTYNRTEDEEVNGVLSVDLGHAWTDTNVEQAPKLIQELANAVGGLRPGQRILSSEAAGGPVLFATVWPWEDGNTVSLRVGCLAPVSGTDDDFAPDARVKAWFGAT